MRLTSRPGRTRRTAWGTGCVTGSLDLGAWKPGSGTRDTPSLHGGLMGSGSSPLCCLGRLWQRSSSPQRARSTAQKSQGHGNPLGQGTVPGAQ